ncbi:type II toxin-antitoxin system HigB family toxin [Pelagibius sp. Alg239-R121]|uniref:type II toxin-antitoxin system HigB family toxin n=1 Tax=Pelagibius sp. Alg239-R121 TaxID=2993448 RepID=UPI0024A703FB|nr:type II toxin-antitoxin system HigB family toxin [Pelagibius sp. Alg239-R121]
MEFWEKHPETEQPLKAWYARTKAADWQNPQEVLSDFGTAKVVSKDRLRFKIHGNNYRMIVGFKFSAGIAFIKFIGTHKEYDQIDAGTVSQF